MIEVDLGADMWEILKSTFFKWSEDNPGERGAAMAYYAMFAIAPLLLIAVSIAGAVFGLRATGNQIIDALRGIVGQEIAAAIQATIKSASRPDAGRFSTLVGLLTSFVGAAGVVGELQSTLNAIWQVKPKPGRGLLGWVQDYAVSFLLVLGLGFFLLVSLVVSAGTAMLSQPVIALLPGGAGWWHWIELGISFTSITVLFALAYKTLPLVHIAWFYVWVGAAVTSALFTLGKILIGWYLARSTIESVYGAAGSIVVILVWVYYTAQVCLFGAEFTWVLVRRRGAEIRLKRNAVFAPDAQQT